MRCPRFPSAFGQRRTDGFNWVLWPFAAVLNFHLGVLHGGLWELAELVHVKEVVAVAAPDGKRRGGVFVAFWRKYRGITNGTTSQCASITR